MNSYAYLLQPCTSCLKQQNLEHMPVLTGESMFNLPYLQRVNRQPMKEKFNTEEAHCTVLRSLIMKKEASDKWNLTLFI